MFLEGREGHKRLKCRTYDRGVHANEKYTPFPVATRRNFGVYRTPAHLPCASP